MIALKKEYNLIDTPDLGGAKSKIVASHTFHPPARSPTNHPPPPHPNPRIAPRCQSHASTRRSGQSQTDQGSSIRARLRLAVGDLGRAKDIMQEKCRRVWDDSLSGRMHIWAMFGYNMSGEIREQHCSYGMYPMQSSNMRS